MNNIKYDYALMYLKRMAEQANSNDDIVSSCFNKLKKLIPVYPIENQEKLPWEFGYYECPSCGEPLRREDFTCPACDQRIDYDGDYQY